MKIGIDLSPSEKDPAGIGQYALSLFTELCRLDSKNEYFVYTHSPFLFANAENRVVRVRKNYPANGVRWMWAVSKDVQKNELNLFISPSNHLFSKLFPRTIQFIHDLAPLCYPEFFGRKASVKYKATVKLAVKNALKILTISETVQQEICELYPKVANRIDYIYPGVNQWVKLENKDQASVLEKYNIDYDYILSLGTLEPRKNHTNTIKAFNEFKRKTLSPLKLVVIGKKGWFFEEIYETVTKLGLDEEVIFLGYVPNQDLNTIIKNAKAFVFLSFYEGFGIPPIEALSLNVKTLVSDIPVFKEAYKDNVLYTDPHSSAKIAVSLQTILDSKGKKTDSFIKENYSWEKSASKLLTILNEYR